MRQPRPRDRAFTLVELLVVVGIIAVLVTITIGVAAAVADSGRKRATEGVLRGLDQTLDIYIETRGQIPPALVEVPPNRLVGGGPLQGSPIFFPLVDGVGRGNSTELVRINSVGLYLLTTRDIPAIQDIIAGLDASLIRSIRSSGSPDVGDAQSVAVQVELQSVVDGWGNPIRMVHPRFDGTIKGGGDFETINLLRSAENGFFAPNELPLLAQRLLGVRQIRRLAPSDEDRRTLTPDEIAENFVGGVGDADGGICPSPRPYFYSAGPDGDPSTIDDNVYTVRPRFGETG
jgi:prepilin-type N-terminal cleavage/methylation domain-containing protein